MPPLSTVMSGSLATTWEVVPSVGRTMNFSLTVRDNEAGGAATGSDDMVVTVQNFSTPFTVNTPSDWTPGSSEQVTWVVGDSNAGSINCQTVNILLTINNGISFTTLVSGVPNTGTATVTVPSLDTNNAKVLVEAADNIFYAVSGAFSISNNIPPTCTTFSSDPNLGLSIPDGTGTNQPGSALTSIINIPANENVSISEIKVNVDITHSYIQDLVITLEHPLSTPGNPIIATLWNRDCVSEDNIDITFETGAAAIDCAQTTGTYEPSGDLSVFNGLDSTGDWTLAITDFFNADTGTLNDWYVETCTTSLSTEDSAIEDLSIYPNPNNGEFNIGFNPKSGEDITIEVYDIRGRNIYTNSFNTVSRFEEVIRLNNAQSGVYLLSISDGPQKVTKKIVID
jgi:subtilisin-like proprotein convertase family protein